MLIKNTFKIMFSNLSMVVMSCLYKLLVISVIFLLGYSVLSPILEEFAKVDIYDSIYEFFAKGLFAFDGSVIISTFDEISAAFLEIMNENVNFTWNFVGLVFILAILLPMLLGFSKVAEYDVLFGKLSSNSNFDFLTSYFDNFKKSFVFRLFRLMFSVPTLIICVLLCYLYSIILVGNVGTVVAIVLMILSIFAVVTLFMTFFLIYEPNLVIKEDRPLKALKNSISNVCEYGFWKVFGILFLVVVVLFLLNALLAVLTYGFALFVTIPLTIQFSNVIRMVICYDCLGMDYYIDKKSVCVTKKRYEKNTIQDLKDVL